MVNHSNHGEFAYRSGPWKLVYKMSDANLQRSRGKQTIAELYNLESDLAETQDLAGSQPEKVKQLSAELAALIDAGASRPIPSAHNDADVRVDRIQTERWAPPPKQGR